MNRNNDIPFNPSAVPHAAAPVYKATQPGSAAFTANRVSQGFREAMKRMPSVSPADTSNNKACIMAAKTTPARKSAVKSTSKWRSSFKPLGDRNPEDRITSSPDRNELYDPYNPASSDSEHEMLEGQDHNQDDNLGPQHLSPSKGCRERSRWDIPYSKTVSQPRDRRDFSPETRPINSQALSPSHRPSEQGAYSPDTESLVPLGYGSTSRPLDHRVGSSDRLTHGALTQRFPASYGAHGMNGEDRIPIPEYRRDVSPTTTAGRSSPSRLKRDYQHQLGYMETGLDNIVPSSDATRNRSKTIIMNKSPIICDFCEAEFANGQELHDHLESKAHWDTLEHIQLKNNYDDHTIAFLQEILLHKSHQCSRAIEDSVLPALQENDHMTKIEIFHCAACNIFLSTSASSVHTHITSEEHLSSTKEFEVRQRRACLDKAETMLKELKPQFEHFLKGGSPFE